MQAPKRLDHVNPRIMVESKGRLPLPPTGYVTWLDFVIESVDTRSLYIDSVMVSKTGIPVTSRKEMQAAVEYELRALRFAAGAIDTYKMRSGPISSPQGTRKRLRFAPTTHEIPPGLNFFDKFFDDISRLVTVTATVGFELAKADAALAWADYAEQVYASWLSMEDISDAELLKILLETCREEP